MTVTQVTDESVPSADRPSGPPAPPPAGRPPSDVSDPELRAAAETEQGTVVDDLGALRHISLVALTVLGTVALSLALHLTLISGLQHRSTQQREYDQLRKEMALGTAPVGQTNSSNRLWALGTPVALIDIPSIHVHQVVDEGTTAGVLMSGPGHRRDTPLPGQAGTSIIMGRQAAYGGPFGSLHKLRNGARVVITTQQAVSSFKVIGLRHGGDPAPPPLSSGNGRLTLITARGTPFLPSSTLRVDADLVTPTQSTPPTAIPFNSLPRTEQAMATDSTTLWALVFYLQALVIVAIAIVWSWLRWGRHQTWIVFLPVTAVLGFFAADQFARLLPNLL